MSVGGVSGGGGGVAVLEAAGPGGEGAEEGADVAAGVVVGEVSIRVEFGVGVGDQDFGPIERVHVEKDEHLTQVVLRARRRLETAASPTGFGRLREAGDAPRG